MAVPRLTGAIRAFSNVCAQDNSSSDGDENSGPSQDLKLKQKWRTQQIAENQMSWQKLASKITRRIKADKDNVTAILRELTQVAKLIVGVDAFPEVIEGAAVHLFQTFCNSTVVKNAETNKLRAIFGPFPASAATKACQVVQRIVAHLPDDIIDELCTVDDEVNVAKEFGKNIKFEAAEFPIVGELEFSSDTDSEDVNVEFDMKYSNIDHASAVKVNDRQKTYSKKYDANWLLAQIESEFDSESSVSAPEMCTTVLNILATSKSDDELQNELFELLGFDRFELIQELLQRRLQVVKSAADMENALAFVKTATTQKVTPENRPNYGCQVTVQTSQEKHVQKQMRKDEKKLLKGNNKLDSEDMATAAALGFDPHALRASREASLIAAMNRPMFSNSKPYQQAPEVYPYVFDSMVEARQASAFISGTKMYLPAEFNRNNTSMYEEIDIPPSQGKSIADVGRQLVPISSLDEIGQVAFQGTKSLNRIQSVVFDTAYKSNENLLICAPTGAGKTNIAMLTILHEIKQHLSQGVIKKDEFKVVYVAPMKALAAEMVRNFGKRLQPLGIAVRELTGDMQLTKMEILKTQMLVTTPEKWDVVTRKTTGDVALSQLVKLLIIDEVHLLHDDRGAVIESLVARTLRQVESSQSMIRIVGLSATLPNYLDVARFLRVNPYKGLFFFDGRFRPVPLGQTFIGIKAIGRLQQLQDMNKVCYDKVFEQVKKGEQVMVFVHARNETVRTAMTLRELAKNKGDMGSFCPADGPRFGEAMKQVMRSRNKEMKELFADGFSIHHAGMLRSDRNMVEKYFADGHLRVLVCTATLAWGVNLPAHAVIIKGTQIYDAKRGTFVDLGILDVMQIFGRAGRPQFDKYGHGTIITTHDMLSHYLSLMTRQNPIESQFTNSLNDNLNAEISLGTVTNIDEAVKWLSYTYMFVRMRCNPLVYGIGYNTIQEDPTLENHRRELVVIAGRALDKAHMIRFDERTGYMACTDLGRTASHFYIKYETVEVFNEMFGALMTEADVFSMVSQAQEFQQIKVRDEEMEELEFHHHDSCVMPAAGGVENAHGKVNILLQTYISRRGVDSFSLISDLSYVAQNSGRITRALFEIALRKGWPIMAGRLLMLSKVIDKRLWEFEHPLRQFTVLSPEILHKIEVKKLTIDKLREMDSKEIGHLIHHVRMGGMVKKCVEQFPTIGLEATIQPITRTVLRVRLTVTPEFTWNDKIHGSGSEPFWIWVEDPDNNHIYHSEYFLLQKKQVVQQDPQSILFTIPIFDPLPTQYIIRAISDRWLKSETTHAISFQHLILPERHPPHTELLDLQPLPISALNDVRLESLYKYTHFNPVQTQIFHTLYHTDCNVLLGAPTGSGKTVAAEMAIFRVFRIFPKMKAVYIAPLKALVRERMEDWKIRIEQKLGRKVVELTGDVTPDMRAIKAADLIITTPEKWDGISRSWQNRSYVQDVALLVIDEIHLLGDDRGPVLEVIVSRTNFISSHTSKAVRVVGLSTALANARDLADWLGIKQMGLFNFRPSVRPVPLEAHIQGFPGKHYCPRMATMNKPTFQAIKSHSPVKPVLIFVSSRRQTRLTALDLIAFLAADDNPKQWLHMPEAEIEQIINGVKDTNLKLMLAFGIGIHHAGLHERDRRTVEELFVNQKIQVLIATSTLAWGVNFPAHLVVIKGTEYYDGKSKRYVDFPITDVLQMMGRAGRPQFDDQGVAVILVHDVKKHFYKKFLYEPFPVESSLLEVLPDHLNAEIVAGTVASKQDAMDYITWTYFFRRLVMNPSYYNLDSPDHETINKYLSNLVEMSIRNLEFSYCIEVGEDERTINPCTLGRIASYYYLHHSSVRVFRDELKPDSSIPSLLEILSYAHEYSDLPVRHNEDQINSELAAKLPLPAPPNSFDNSNTKTFLLFQAHFGRIQLPSTDYLTDTKSVLDQAIRVLQAMLDLTADQGWLVSAIRIIHILQMTVQGRWIHDSSLLMLPHIEHYHLFCFRNPEKYGLKSPPIETIAELVVACGGSMEPLSSMLQGELAHHQIEQIFQVMLQMPIIDMNIEVQGWWEGLDGQQAKHANIRHRGGRRPDEDWIQVHADQEYVLNIRLTRLNKTKKRDSKAFAPKFTKAKDEGWFLIVGDIENQELIAIKRIGFVRQSTNVTLSIYSPENTGRVIYTVYLLSNCYLGLDQQYDICFDVLPPSIEAQVNTELKGELEGLDFGDNSLDMDEMR
ncbi:activating signal cointegrator 1 complex subunit 3-like [Tubulanus polymorphus]|uniref:activating signal cointegrator 1 complex subunit 3-like n=1 Tax=Tubulanus polymorphus TaxID=672921 RepID=UPI003DA4B0AC